MQYTNIPCITSADDMGLLSLSKKGLDRLLNICHLCSKKWLFAYNPQKCSVIVFNESKHDHSNSTRKWSIGYHTLHETVNYTHLGVVCNKCMSNAEIVKDICSKIRGSFMSLFIIGLNEKEFHPFTCKKLYDTIVLSGGLLGIFLKIFRIATARKMS